MSSSFVLTVAALIGVLITSVLVLGKIDLILSFLASQII